MLWGPMETVDERQRVREEEELEAHKHDNEHARLTPSCALVSRGMDTQKLELKRQPTASTPPTPPSSPTTTKSGNMEQAIDTMSEMQFVCQSALDLLFKEPSAKEDLDALAQSNKRQKSGGFHYMDRVDLLQREIEELEALLAGPAPSDLVQQVRELGREQVQLVGRLQFLRQKWQQHEVWLRRLGQLLAHAPLAEYALAKAHFGQPLESKAPVVGVDKDDDRAASMERKVNDFALIDEWMTSGSEFIAQVVAERLKVTTERSTYKHTDLLLKYRNGQLAFEYDSESYGWQLSTGILEPDKVGLMFGCRRVLQVVPTLPFEHDFGSKNVLRSVASELWASIQQDEVFRVYCPGQEEMTTILSDECHALNKRHFRTEALRNPLEFSTTECLTPFLEDEDPNGSGNSAITGTNGWLIAIETVDDCYLDAVVAKATLSSKGATLTREDLPFIVPDLFDNNPRQEKDNTSANYCLVAIEATLIHDSEIEVNIAGRIRFGSTTAVDCKRLALVLLQHFTTYFPVFEANHLSKWLNEAEACSLNDEQE